MRLIRLLVLVCALCAPLLLTAQNPRLLRFAEPVRNLGQVREVDGVVKLRYEFTNISDKSVTLLDIHTQCGCLKPVYNRRPIAPGGKGVIDVTFDPKNRLGDFSIGLTVIAANGDYQKFSTLKAEGYVVSRIPEEEIYYPYRLSATLRADLETIGMRQFEPGDGLRTRQLKVFNTSDQPIRVSYSTDDPHLRVSGPEQIDARSQGIVSYVLDPQGMKPGRFVIQSVIRDSDTEIPVEVRGVILEK